MKKVVFFGFTGELMCFAHALFNAQEMLDNGWEVKVVLEGQSTALIEKFASDQNPFNKVYLKLKEKSLISVCRACANKMGSLAAAEAEGIPIEDALLGHPSMHSYLDAGWEIITI
jgi:hypothetical protein